MKVVTAAEMRQIDEQAIAKHGIPGAELMEQAGRAVANGVAGMIGPGPVLVLCGRGNNGGDGFVAARYLAQSGYNVYIIPVFGTDGLSVDALRAFERLPEGKHRLLQLPDEEGFASLVQEMDGVVDAILGTGAKPPLKAPLDWIARVLNASGVPVIAADVPTGLDADTGEGEHAIRAARTVTIGLPKKGMLGKYGIQCCGNVVVEAINFPRELLENQALKYSTVLPQEAAALLPARLIGSHKGSFGLTVICAGSARMPGASVICGYAALRSGVGLVGMHVPTSIKSIVASHLPEAIFSLAEATYPDTLAPLAEHDWQHLISKTDSIVIGPGISLKDGPRGFLEQVLGDFDGPVVVDADALSLIAQEKDMQKLLHPRCILTPHPGEMARLLENEIRDNEKDRWAAAQQAASRFGCIVVHKGYLPLIGLPDGEVIHVPTGNTALARGATGDMLAGLIGGLLAQGATPRDGAVLGTYVGGLAADILVRERSSRGVIVREILETLPLAWRELENLQAGRPDRWNAVKSLS